MNPLKKIIMITFIYFNLHYYSFSQENLMDDDVFRSSENHLFPVNEIKDICYAVLLIAGHVIIYDSTFVLAIIISNFNTSLSYTVFFILPTVTITSFSYIDELLKFDSSGFIALIGRESIVLLTGYSLYFIDKHLN